MVSGRFKSRTFRRVFKKLPGGTTKIHYEKRKPSKAKCGSCSILLKGVPRERPYKMKATAKTKKRPQRPYGGSLCSSCTRKLIKEKIRNVKK